MLANMIFVLFTSLWLYGVHAIVVPVRISRGAVVKPVENLIYYEASVPLFYESNITSFQETKKFSRENCEGYGDCKLYDEFRKVFVKAENAISHVLFFEDLNTTESKRSKRSVSFIGEFAEYCCNIASSETVNSMFINEQHLDTFMTQMKAELSSDHEMELNTRKVLNQYSAEMKDVINQLSQTSRADIRGLAEAEGNENDRIMQISATLFTTARIIYQHAQTTSFLKVMSDCDNRKLPALIIDPKTLKEDLTRLEKQIEKDGFHLAVPVKKLSQYFSLTTTSCEVTNTRIRIKVKVPIIRHATVCQLYHINTLPFVYENSVCKLNLDFDQVGKCNDEFFPLIGSMHEICNPSKSSLCLLSRRHKISSLSTKCASHLIAHKTTARDIAL